MRDAWAKLKNKNKLIYSRRLLNKKSANINYVFVLCEQKRKIRDYSSQIKDDSPESFFLFARKKYTLYPKRPKM